MSDSPETNCCGCHADQKRAASDPSYRRALWIVVLLNLGFGLVEIVGGFFARSQALKADALDFLGDGSITLVGLFALGWAEHTRARVALTQGCFLAALGFGVIAAAIWRAVNTVPPEAHLMGGFPLGMKMVPFSDGQNAGTTTRRKACPNLHRPTARGTPQHPPFFLASRSWRTKIKTCDS
jgi:hypothetical protein